MRHLAARWVLAIATGLAPGGGAAGHSSPRDGWSETPTEKKSHNRNELPAAPNRKSGAARVKSHILDQVARRFPLAQRTALHQTLECDTRLGRAGSTHVCRSPQ